uniref:Transmembrane protein n=1 Tax=Cacopsylla melanoneura TaxID=428564 RepID=A0A8D9E7Q4_9HEMI
MLRAKGASLHHHFFCGRVFVRQEDTILKLVLSFFVINLLSPIILGLMVPFFFVFGCIKQRLFLSVSNSVLLGLFVSLERSFLRTGSSRFLFQKCRNLQVYFTVC